MWLTVNTRQNREKENSNETIKNKHGQKARYDTHVTSPTGLVFVLSIRVQRSTLHFFLIEKKK